MLHETLVVGPIQCNCHILADERSREAVVIDPGGDAERILDVVRANDLKVKALVHTHAHLDHIWATAELKEATGADILLHGDDLFLYDNLPMQAKMLGWRAEPTRPVDRKLEDGATVSFGALSLLVAHTPGHSPGSVCLALPAEGGGVVTFTGDTLFRRSVGRTDLWGGDTDALLRSIRAKLLSLDDGTRVYPGHNEPTTIGEERRKNPFLRD